MKQIMNMDGLIVTDAVELACIKLIGETSGKSEAMDECGQLSIDFDTTIKNAQLAIAEVYGEMYKCPRYFTRREGPFQSGAVLVVCIDNEDNVFRIREDKTQEGVAMTLADCEQYVKGGQWCEIPLHIARRLGVLE